MIVAGGPERQEGDGPVPGFDGRLGQHAGMSWPGLAPFPSRE